MADQNRKDTKGKDNNKDNKNSASRDQQNTQAPGRDAQGGARQQGNQDSKQQQAAGAKRNASGVDDGIHAGRDAQNNRQAPGVDDGIHREEAKSGAAANRSSDTDKPQADDEQHRAR